MSQKPGRQFSHRFRSSLRWPVLATLSALLLVFLSGASYSIYRLVSQQEAQRWEERQLSETEYAVQIVSVFLDEQIRDLAIASRISADQLSSDTALRQEILNQQPAWLELVRVDATGKEIINLSRKAPLLNNPVTIPQSTWFVEASDGRFYVGNLSVSADNEPYIIIAQPASDGGVIAALLNMNVLWEAVSNVSYGETGLAFVVNNRGHVIAHPNIDLVLARTSIADTPQFEKILNSAVSREIFTTTNLAGEAVQAAAAQVPGSRWYIVTEVEQDEVGRVSRNAAIAFVVFMLVVGFLGTLLINHLLIVLIFHPLQRLQAGIDRISQGDLDYTIQMRHQDEFGMVAQAFNSMAGSLKERQEQVLIARDQAQEANRFKSEMLAKVSHEFRTPLGVIIGYGEMLTAGVYGEMKKDQTQKVNELVESAQGLNQLVNDLLDQARLEAGEIKLVREPVDLSELVNRIINQMSYLAQIKKIKLTSEIEREMPATLLGDEGRLQQILVNLVNNAIKFTEKGGVHIRIMRPDADFWAIQVSDTGIGIPLSAQHTIFEPFRQVDGSVTRQRGGTGLGLSIVRQLTLAMGGTIHLDSLPGRGSTFTILLPLILKEEKPHESPVISPPTPRTGH